jgi:hypothetical protein
MTPVKKGAGLERQLFGEAAEEVVALVVDDDEGGEVLDLDAPDASMPSSGYSSTSTLRMQSCASRAAGPPIEPR